MFQRSYQYRLYPTAAQERELTLMLGTFCDLYNAGLEERISAWRRGICRNYYDQANQLKEARQHRPDLARYSFSAEQQVLRRLNKAYQAFFRRVKAGEKAGFPRFQAQSRWDSAEFRVGDGLRLDPANRLRLVGISGSLKLKWHRALPAQPSAAILHRNAGRWYITFQLELPGATKVRADFSPVGGDLGLNALLALSDGALINTLPFYRNAEKKQRRLQRSVARKRLGSKRRRKAKRNLARHSARTANRRKDFAHKLSGRLVETHSHIALENLNIKGLAGGMLAKSVHNAAWAQLIAMILYKAESAGTVVALVNPRGTSQACSGCGSCVPKDLSVRVHVCPDCGLILDRDVNAARNILSLARFSRPGPGLQAQSTPARARLA